MDDIANDPGLVLNAFWVTIQLAVLSGLASLVLGTLLAAMRVGPVGVLAKFGTVYVSVVRNTPLLIDLRARLHRRTDPGPAGQDTRSWSRA